MARLGLLRGALAYLAIAAASAGLVAGAAAQEAEGSGPRPATETRGDGDTAREAIDALATAVSYVRTSAATSCPGAAAFRRAVHGRLGSPSSLRTPTNVEVIVGGDTAGLRADLVIDDPSSGETATRALTSTSMESCDGIFGAAALATALALDPDRVARARAAAETSAASATVESEPPSEAAAAGDALGAATEPGAAEPETARPVRAPSSTDRLTRRSAEGAADVGRDGAPPAPSIARPSPRYAASHPNTRARRSASPGAALGLGGSVRIGSVPGAALGVDAYGEVPLTGRWGVRLAFAALPERRLSTSVGSFGLGLTALGAMTCAQPIAVSWVRVVACGGIEAGLLHVTVRDPVPTDPGDHAVASFRGEVGARLPLLRGFELELSLGGMAALLRRSLEVRGVAQPVYESPPFGAGASLRLRWRVP